MTFNLESMEREAKAMADGPYRYGEGQNLLALIADYKRLKAEVEALRKDAYRYRWLRDTATGPWMRALDLYARRDKRMDVAIDEEINRMAKP